MASVLDLPRVRPLLSSEHFSVDGTLIEAWASSGALGDEVLREKFDPPSAGILGQCSW
jgi:hypothetical protein